MTSQEQKPVIPKLAQDLIAGTIGGWAQVVVGKSFFETNKEKKNSHRNYKKVILLIPSRCVYKHNLHLLFIPVLWIVYVNLSRKKV